MLVNKSGPPPPGYGPIRRGPGRPRKHMGYLQEWTVVQKLPTAPQSAAPSIPPSLPADARAAWQHPYAMPPQYLAPATAPHYVAMPQYMPQPGPPTHPGMTSPLSLSALSALSPFSALAVPPVPVAPPPTAAAGPPPQAPALPPAPAPASASASASAPQIPAILGKAAEEVVAELTSEYAARVKQALSMVAASWSADVAKLNEQFAEKAKEQAEKAKEQSEVAKSESLGVEALLGLANAHATSSAPETRSASPAYRMPTASRGMISPGSDTSLVTQAAGEESE